MNPINETLIDTSVFCENYINDISLERLYVLCYKKIYSTIRVRNLNINPDTYIQSLKDEGFTVEIHGTFRKITYPNDDEGFSIDLEYIFVVNESILINAAGGLLKIVYGRDIPFENIKKITDIYLALKKKRKYN